MNGSKKAALIWIILFTVITSVNASTYYCDSCDGCNEKIASASPGDGVLLST